MHQAVCLFVFEWDRPCFSWGGGGDDLFFSPMVLCFCLKTDGFVDSLSFRMLGVIPPSHFADLCQSEIHEKPSKSKWRYFVVAFLGRCLAAVSVSRRWFQRFFIFTDKTWRNDPF